MRGIWWVDLNENALKEAQDLLTDDNSDTIDDLGFGSVRDLISEKLFPATSTIMTEVRYFVFLTALFSELERRQLKGADAARELENLEEEQLRALMEGHERTGIIGYTVGRPQRLPTDIYWAAMRTLGIHHFRGSRNRYLQSMDASYYKRIAEWRKGSKDRDYDDQPPDHFSIHQFSTGWEQISKSTTFEMTREEVRWLKGRFEVSETVNSSFFVHLMRNEALVSEKASEADFWELYNHNNVPVHYASLIHDARCYSYLQQGSQHMYNLLLRSSDDHVQSFEKWRENDEFNLLKEWDYPKFRSFLTLHKIGRPTLEFHEFWLKSVMEDWTTMELRDRIKFRFEQREKSKKGLSRSRLLNPERADNYRFGSHRYQFRWHIARSFLIRMRQGELKS